MGFYVFDFFPPFWGGGGVIMPCIAAYVRMMWFGSVLIFENLVLYLCSIHNLTEVKVVFCRSYLVGLIKCDIYKSAKLDRNV